MPRNIKKVLSNFLFGIFPIFRLILSFGVSCSNDISYDDGSQNPDMTLREIYLWINELHFNVNHYSEVSNVYADFFSSHLSYMQTQVILKLE